VNTTAAAGSPAIRLPYGKYKACAEFNKTAGSGTNGTYSTVFNGPIDNTKFGPPTTALSSPVINIDTTNTANKVSCAGRGAW
jgi:hypothetical protein